MSEEIRIDSVDKGIIHESLNLMHALFTDRIMHETLSVEGSITDLDLDVHKRLHKLMDMFNKPCDCNTCKKLGI